MNTRLFPKPIRFLFVFLWLLTTPVMALEDSEIAEFLTASRIIGNQNGVEWNQTFRKNGTTTYSQVAGRPSPPSDGLWRISNGQYCSQWPPSSHWECYDVTINGNEIVFYPKGGGEPWPAVQDN